jgi:hypothetical protein
MFRVCVCVCVCLCVYIVCSHVHCINMHWTLCAKQHIENTQRTHREHTENTFNTCAKQSQEHTFQHKRTNPDKRTWEHIFGNIHPCVAHPVQVCVFITAIPSGNRRLSREQTFIKRTDFYQENRLFSREQTLLILRRSARQLEQSSSTCVTSSYTVSHHHAQCHIFMRRQCHIITHRSSSTKGWKRWTGPSLKRYGRPAASYLISGTCLAFDACLG